MDVEERIRELKRELEMLEAMRNAPQPNQYLGYAKPQQGPAPYLQPMPSPRPMAPGDSGIEVMPYRNKPGRLDDSNYIQKMPYRNPTPSLDGPRRPNQYIKKL